MRRHRCVIVAALRSALQRGARWRAPAPRARRASSLHPAQTSAVCAWRAGESACRGAALQRAACRQAPARRRTTAGAAAATDGGTGEMSGAAPGAHHAAAPAKIDVANPVVELDGDEQARVIWQRVKERLITPYLNLDTVYFDLALTERDRTNDAVTTDAARSILMERCAVKAATITPDEQRVREFSLARMYPSPNATLRNMLNGTVFREPIMVDNVPRLVPGWREPIVIARHGFGDQYRAQEFDVPPGATMELVMRDGRDNEAVQRKLIYRFGASDLGSSSVHDGDGSGGGGGGVALGMFNTDESIRNFAASCFRFALERRMPLYLSTKNTILKTYDGRWRDIFQRMYDAEYRERFEAHDLSYEHRLIDDMVAQALKSRGGFLWACKNYDGDVQSDIIAQGYGSLGLMSSVLLAADTDTLLAEAAHGTVTRHYRMHQRGEETSTNSVASIVAWARGLAHRARLDDNAPLATFARALERACTATIESGRMTKDLAIAVHGAERGAQRDYYLSTEEFIDAVGVRLRGDLAASVSAASSASSASSTAT